MEQKMFCFQCEQTAGCTGCMGKAGVCGKTADVAKLQDELKKYSHLKGNFGTAWQNQQKEFAELPAPVLFTTNCLMPPKANYADRVFTTEVVSYPKITHIGEDKDFTPVIEKALELGGYSEDKHFTGINGGSTVMTDFARGTVLGVADQVVEAVKSGAIRHFFLVAGCDGARPGRNYYTEFVKQTPADTVVLTLACGKYRFNDLDLGTIGGLPRLMDVGQCNDAYSAIQIAVALADAFGCGVNDLPLSMVLSWYEQKAVCILLTLLYLGIKNIRHRLRPLVGAVGHSGVCCCSFERQLVQSAELFDLAVDALIQTVRLIEIFLCGHADTSILTMLRTRFIRDGPSSSLRASNHSEVKKRSSSATSCWYSFRWGRRK